MNFEINQTYTFKLTSGEELVAKVVGLPDSEGFLEISEPVSVAPGPQGVGLMPSLFTGEQQGTCRVNTKNVTMVAQTAEQVKDKYLEATTGIKVPSKKILVG
jgi:hypothetical protein